MTHPLGSIKALATDTVKVGVTLPARVAARAYGVARGAATMGARMVTDSRHAPTSPQEAAASTPVNVVDELGLDPAPADQPGTTAPITSIDAQADPDQVDATPADVAQRVTRVEGQE